jgi:hypothetical protein
MQELILEADPQAKELFEAFASDHPEEASVEVSRGADGATLISLIIENAPMLSASVALLIGTLKGRGIKVKVSPEGLDLSIGADQEK